MVAAGYSDGSIKLWNIKQRKCTVTLNGHKGAVTALLFNESGSLLVSGAADTNVIVWDVVNESGLYK
jgi:U3 small nucleolar RNA-associated protein 12